MLYNIVVKFCDWKAQIGSCNKCMYVCMYMCGLKQSTRLLKNKLPIITSSPASAYKPTTFIAFNVPYVVAKIMTILLLHPFCSINCSCYCGIFMVPLIQVTYLTATWQTLDLITKPGSKFENFTLERYTPSSRYFTYKEF